MLNILEERIKMSEKLLPKIIIASTSPIPAVRGGAVETLTTMLIEANERNPHFRFLVFTTDVPEFDRVHYVNTELRTIKKTNEIFRLPFRIFNRLCRFLHIQFQFDLQAFRIAWAMHKEQCDYILVENHSLLFHEIRLTNRTNAKMIYHWHNGFQNDKFREYAGRKYARYILKNADLVLAVSQYIKERLSKDKYKDNIKVYYNAVDFHKFYPNLNIIDTRNQLQIGEKAIVFLYAGRMSEEKGLEKLLQAASLLPQEMNYILLIAGKKWFGTSSENEYFVRVKKIAHQIKNHIKFTGYIDNNEINKYYSAADWTVVPSVCDEAFGMTALESIACGTPVLAANSGGLPEVVKPGTGLLVSHGENFVFDLAEEMKKIISGHVNVLPREEIAEAARAEFKGALGYFNQFCELLKDNV